jgi:hypothetical protein
MRWARRLAENLTLMINDNDTSGGVNVFPYSIFYVFYEQVSMSHMCLHFGRMVLGQSFVGNFGVKPCPNFPDNYCQFLSKFVTLMSFECFENQDLLNCLLPKLVWYVNSGRD